MCLQNDRIESAIYFPLEGKSGFSWIDAMYSAWVRKNSEEKYTQCDKTFTYSNALSGRIGQIPSLFGNQYRREMQ